MGAFDTTVGVLVIGISFNTYLYGLVTYQFLVYLGAKFNDSRAIKAVVYSLFAVDTIHSAVAVYALWEQCVTNYDNPAFLAVVSWTIPFTACATSVVALISQFFLGHRVLILTKSKVLYSAICITSVLGCIFGFIAGIRSGIIRDVSKFGVLAPLVTCWLSFQTSSDVLITAALTFSLSRSRTGFRRTDTVINRLIRGAIQTGLFVSIFALGDLFSFLLLRQTNLYAMFAYPIGRIYTNTLLDTLNTRRELKALSNTIDVDSQTQNKGIRINTSYLQPTRDNLDNYQLSQIHVRKDTVTDAVDASDKSVYSKSVAKVV